MAEVTLAEQRAMTRAIELAARGPAFGPNPQVGCVIISGDTPIGEGWHAGAGTDHAEAVALADARRRAPERLRGATAVQTLEPCNHTGRRPPCSAALIDAGITRVVMALTDPNPVAAGGMDRLQQAGIDVVAGEQAAGAIEAIWPWYRAMTLRRPYVIAKIAATLDGRVAAQDGTSQWITGQAARAHAHLIRSQVDAIGVGTGTLLADDPSLTARYEGRHGAAHFGHQPVRVVFGNRALPPQAAIRGRGAAHLRLTGHNVSSWLDELFVRQLYRVLVEGGATVLSAFLAEDCVDEIHAYLAPTLLGSGRNAVEPFGIHTLTDAPNWRPYRVEQLGRDVLIMARRD